MNEDGTDLTSPKAIEAFPEANPPPADRSFQPRVADWMMKCFGADITNSRQERNYRFSEEAGEWCQAQGMTLEQWIEIGRYIWGRQVGEPVQEAGGVMVTFAAACTAAGIDMAEAGETELTRINAPETIDNIRRKHHAKTLRTPHSALAGKADAGISGAG